MAYDLLIRGGQIVDGTGRAPVAGNVAVQDGRIVAVGQTDGSARRVIDADGLTIAPGFIDHHTHMDAQIWWDPLATSCPMHGVTSTVHGNCGLTLHPCRPGDRLTLASTLSRVEAISLDALQTAVPWSWESTADYLAALAARPLGVNVGSLVGHCALRYYVLGEAAVEREATETEVEEMKAHLRASLQAGALGFSTNQNPRHMRTDGAPVPSRLASEDEIIHLSAVVGEFPSGVVQTIKTVATPEYIEWAGNLARYVGRPVLWQIFVHLWAYPTLWRDQIAAVEAQFARGAEAYGLANTVPLMRRYSLKNLQQFDEFPTWREVMFLPLEERRRAFSDPEVRRKLRWEVVEDPAPSVAFHKRWDLVWVENVAREENRRYKGKSIAAVAAEQGKDVLDAFLDLALAEDLETRFCHSSSNGDDAATAAILQSPYALVGESDAGAHVQFDAGFGYCTTLLGEWVRDKQIMPLETAVYKLTKQVADLYGLVDRGTIAAGKAADLVVFDPTTVGALEPERTNDFPGGEPRMIQRAAGVHFTIVNGEPIVERGVPTGAQPGQVLRGAGRS
jgi:N-acyl-D-aspartate/D-glutamate deacylase